MSHALELVGFTLLSLAALTLFGRGVAEAVGGLSLLILAQGVNDGAIKACVVRVLRRPKA